MHLLQQADMALRQCKIVEKEHVKDVGLVTVWRRGDVSPQSSESYYIYLAACICNVLPRSRPCMQPQIYIL